ncbi:hypothetical protein PCASD_06736 [Puccinia coronata f. sp. avenae]|uniref:DNA-directed RNA polymerase M/15kDa subunit domain-containing protein n=1 Tax=Puccinia coronata f. sp. avenae TaxID=200324 RepID=A0A2N5V0K5_9BASI|nr:hypothetical protein PCASD_06736 [Puccinia coronata f. sp. avenae]
MIIGSLIFCERCGNLLALPEQQDPEGLIRCVQCKRSQKFNVQEDIGIVTRSNPNAFPSILRQKRTLVQQKTHSAGHQNGQSAAPLPVLSPFPAAAEGTSRGSQADGLRVFPLQEDIRHEPLLESSKEVKNGNDPLTSLSLLPCPKVHPTKRLDMFTNAATRLAILHRAVQTPNLLPASHTLASLRVRSSFNTEIRKLATVAVSADQSSSTSRTSSLPSISNIEAAWKEMSPQEQEAVFHHLEGLQKKDWTQLTLDEKKASYWVSFGPHGPREPLHAPGSGIKLLLGITGCVSAAIALFVLIRSASPELPRTMTKEWQEAATQRAIEQKMDPFTGASAQGEKAKTFVQSK